MRNRIFISSAGYAAAALLAVVVLLCAPRALAQQPAADQPIMAPQILPGDITLRKDYTIVVNGTVISPDVPPVERGGIIFVPLRFVTEALGASVTWNAELHQVTVRWASSTMMFVVDQYQAEKDGKPILLDAPPFIYGDRTMIPLKVSAQGGGFKVQETPGAMVINRPENAGATPATNVKKETPPEGTHPGLGALDEIKKKAKSDPITQKLKWYVLGLWGIALLFWVAKLIMAFFSKEDGRFRDIAIIFVILCVAVPLILTVMLSTYWAATVAIVTCIVGMVSTEEYEDKIVTMANTAQGVGLICTLFGLGLLIGPAIAARDIAAIGYGIYVKIEPTITGLSISIFLNMLYGYEARKRRKAS